MIDYLISIGTRKGPYAPLSGRDEGDARLNSEGTAEFHMSGVRSHYHLSLSPHGRPPRPQAK
jgi:hypothetical protein